MKYVVTKQNRFSIKLYAVVSRDESVVWNPQRNKASEMDKDKAVRIANRHGAIAKCAECGGSCDHILATLKEALAC